MLDLDDTFSEEHKELQNFDCIVAHLGVEVTTDLSEVLTFKGKSSPGVEAKRENDTTAMDLFCLDAWCALSDLRDIFVAADKGKARHDDSLLEDAMVGAYCGHPFAAALYSIHEDLQALASKPKLGPWHNVDGFLTDVFTRGLMWISQYGTLHTWMLSAFTAYTEVYNALGMQPGTGREACAALGKGWSASIQEYCKLVKRHPHHRAIHVPSLEGELRNMDACFTRDRFEDWTTARVEGASSYHLLDALLVLAGHHMFEAAMLDRGLWAPRVANDKLALLATAYLYKAARASGILGAEWPDMEVVLAAQGIHGPLVRESKAGILGFARHCNLASGLEASVFACHGVWKPKLPSAQRLEEKPRAIELTSPYVLTQLDRYPLYRNATMGGHGRFNAVLYQVVRQQQGLSTTHQHTKLLPPTELLNALRQSLAGSEMQFNFDYMIFYRRCQLLLDVLMEDFAVEMSELHNTEELTHHGMANEILWECAAVERRPRQSAVPQTMLHRTAHHLKEVIIRYGSECQKKAIAACAPNVSGKERPSDLWRWGGDAQQHSTDRALHCGPLTPEVARKQQQRKLENRMVLAIGKKNVELKGLTTSERHERLRDWANEELCKTGSDRRVYRVSGDDGLTQKLQVAFMDWTDFIMASHAHLFRSEEVANGV